MKVALFSIKPCYAWAILDGSKRYEYRKTKMNSAVNTIYIYATAPIQRVVGCVQLKRCISASPDIVWTATRQYAGLDRRTFDCYFSNANQAYAYELSCPIRYSQPRLLSDYGLIRPPQSFCYVEEIC